MNFISMSHMPITAECLNPAGKTSSVQEPLKEHNTEFSWRILYCNVEKRASVVMSKLGSPVDPWFMRRLLKPRHEDSASSFS